MKGMRLESNPIVIVVGSEESEVDLHLIECRINKSNLDEGASSG